MTFTVQGSELARALEVLKAAKKEIGYFEVKSSSDVAKVSVIGVGMRSHAGVAAQMFKALGRERHQYPGHHHFGDQDQRA